MNVIRSNTERKHQFRLWKWKRLTLQNTVCSTRYRTRLAGGPLLRVSTISRTTDTFLFISHTTNVLLSKFRCNIFIGVRIIKEMPGSVASGTRCTTQHFFSSAKVRRWKYSLFLRLFYDDSLDNEVYDDFSVYYFTRISSHQNFNCRNEKHATTRRVRKVKTQGP